MALVKKETKEYSCDFCKEICTPVTSYRYTHSTTEQGNWNEIIFNVTGRLPFVTDNPDICHTCARDAAQFILNMYLEGA